MYGRPRGGPIKISDPYARNDDSKEAFAYRHGIQLVKMGDKLHDAVKDWKRRMGDQPATQRLSQAIETFCDKQHTYHIDRTLGIDFETILHLI